MTLERVFVNQTITSGFPVFKVYGPTRGDSV
jgi:hypothetical protein